MEFQSLPKNDVKWEATADSLNQDLRNVTP